MSTHDVTYRAGNERDIAQIVELFRSQWCGDQSYRAGRAAAEANIYRYLCSVDWSLVAESGNGEVLGAVLMALGDGPSEKERVLWNHARTKTLDSARFHGADEDELMREVRIVERETEIGAEYAVAHPSELAEIKLLIVSPDARGLGVGRSLFVRALEEAHAHGKRTFLLTDDTCDVGFYEHAGLQRDAARTHSRGEGGDGASVGIYVYVEAKR